MDVNLFRERYPIIMKSFAEMDREVFEGFYYLMKEGFFLRVQSVINVIRLNWMISRRVDKKELETIQALFFYHYLCPKNMLNLMQT